MAHQGKHQMRFYKGMQVEEAGSRVVPVTCSWWQAHPHDMQRGRSDGRALGRDGGAQEPGLVSCAEALWDVFAQHPATAAAAARMQQRMEACPRQSAAALGRTAWNAYSFNLDYRTGASLATEHSRCSSKLHRTLRCYTQSKTWCLHSLPALLLTRNTHSSQLQHALRHMIPIVAHRSTSMLSLGR